MKIKGSDFKMRASQAGILMTRGGASSKTVKTYLQDWLKEQIYGVKKEFKSKYTDKGNAMEDKAIDFAIQNMNMPFTLKNEQHFENSHFTGTPDVIVPIRTVDTKCSWDAFTFPLFDTFMKSEREPHAEWRNYYDQGQVYMNLTGRKNHTVVFCLMNTPENIAPWENHYDYSNVPEKYRLREWTFGYDSERIEILKNTVEDCRLYLDELIDKLK